LAKLHLDSLKGKKSPRELQKALSTLEKGNNAYDEVYLNTLQRINGQVSDQRDLAMNTLMWIVYAKRPLTTVEPQHALSVEIGELKLLEDNLSDLDDILSACCGLVTVDEKSDIVRLIHYTTQEFLERRGEQCFPEAQRRITNVCITYLSFDVFGDGPCQKNEDLKQRLAKFRLYEYASKHWGHHAYSQADLESIRDFLARPSHIKACGQLLTLPKSYYFSMPSASQAFNLTSLHLAAYFGLTSIVSDIWKDYNLDIQDSNLYRTPLWYAAAQGHQSTVNLLLDIHYQPDIADDEGSTPLLVASKQGHKEVVRLLLEKGAHVDHANSSGWSPLLSAARHGHEEVVRLLLEQDAQVDLAGIFGWTPLMWAAKHGHKAVVRLLLDEGAQVEHMAKHGRTPLFLALQGGCEDTIALLLGRDADVNTTMDTGRTPLLLASQWGYTKTVELLIERGARVNAVSGAEALMSAARIGNWEILESLLAAGADQRVKDIVDRSALMYAIMHKHSEAVDVLLAKEDLDINARDHWGATAISFAARLGYSKMFRKITALPDVDLQSEDLFGRTSLWWAQRQGHDSIANEIIEHHITTNNEVIQTQMLRAVGEPKRFLTDSLGEEGLCDVCIACLDDSWYQCDDCPGGPYAICLECHGLGAHCLVKSHNLSFKKDMMIDEA
jgi:ankyrin repeat protein